MSCTTRVVQIPGAMGLPGLNGVDGLDGEAGFGLAVGGEFAPNSGLNVTIGIDHTDWAPPGGTVYIQFWGYYTILSAPSDVQLTLQNLGSSGNAVAGTVLPPGAIIAASGPPGTNGVMGGVAGGQLTGNYPNPTLAIPNAKGALVVGNGAAAVSQAAGANGERLVYDSTQATGVRADKVDLTDATEVSGPLPLTLGGTGAATKAAAFDALSPLTTRGDSLIHTGATNTRDPIGAANEVRYSDGLDQQWGKVTSAMLDSTAIMAQMYTGVAPPAAPTDPTKPAIFYPSSAAPPGTNLQTWDIPTLAWI